MRTRGYLLCTALLLAAAVLNVRSPAQARPGTQPPAPAPESAAPAEGLTDDMKLFLTRISAAYRQAGSYRDEGRATIVQLSGKVKTTTEVPMHVAFLRPNFLKLDAGQYEAACDGKQLYFAVPSARQYTLTKAPDALDRKQLPTGSIMGGSEEGHPEVIDLLTRDDTAAAILQHVKKISWRPDADIGGIPCRVLRWETGSTRLTVFVDKARHVLLRAEGESEPASDPEQNSTVDSIRMTYDFTSAELNPQLKADDFALTIPQGYKHVREIGGEAVKPETSGKGQSPLTGTKLPALSGSDLAGAALKPDEYKGRALLLFFWSASGSDHSLVSIPVIQGIADKYRGDGALAVLAVNTDQSPRPVVPRMLELKKATFRCLTDETYRLRKLFKLEGVPTFILADRDGMIRWSQLGAPPGLKDALEAEIAKIVSGTK